MDNLMNSEPLISVIIPVYNAEKYLMQAIESILNQTYTNLEILIADDGSTDNSKKIIDSYSDSRIKHFHNENNLGYLKTCNKLFEFATGDFIIFQDADDWSVPERLQILVNKFEEDPELMLCGSNFSRVESDGKRIISSSKLPESTEAIVKSINERKDRFPILGGTAMFKRSIIQNIGGYRTFFDRLGCEDVDWIILITEKFKCINCSDILYYYRYIPDSVSRKDILKNFKKYYILDIVYFLKAQRQNYGKDGLQAKENKNELDKYLNGLEKEFNNERLPVYKKLIMNRLSNGDLKEALNLFKDLSKEGKNNMRFSFYFLYRYLRSMSKALIRK
jgi:glycosyltransferase involved in cell wall biosynthesis